MSQSSYFKCLPNPVTLGELEGGNLKSWKTLGVEGSGSNLVGKISRSLRYMIEIIGTDLICLGTWGEGQF